MNKKKLNKSLIFLVSSLFITGIMTKTVFADASVALLPVAIIMWFFQTIFPYIIISISIVAIIVLIVILFRRKKKR